MVHDGRIVALCHARDGSLWIGRENGNLAHFRDARVDWVKVSSDPSLPAAHAGVGEAVGASDADLGIADELAGRGVEDAAGKRAGGGGLRDRRRGEPSEEGKQQGEGRAGGR